METLSKIVGFTVSEKQIVHENIDIFGANLTFLTFEYAGFYVYLWGIGQISHSSWYSLGFPPSHNLSDRNVLIEFRSNEIIIENDWLGSIPVYYNSKEKIISTLSTKCLKDKTFSENGRSNYFEFGYAVFGQTAFEDVKFMEAYSSLKMSAQTFGYETKKDIYAEQILNENSEYQDFNTVVEAHKNYMLQIENQYNFPKIIPTSGGFDSRLLNLWTANKAAVFSYTYGISKRQAESQEVVYAQKLSQLLGTNWQQVQLGNFMQYFRESFGIFGFSSGLFTMYHIDFYKKIKANLPAQNMLWYSGIFGDAWSGGISPIVPDTPNDLCHLGYRHGLHMDKRFISAKENPIKNAFFSKNLPFLKTEGNLLLNIVRTKAIFISYLATLPEYFGYPVVTPFLNYNLVKQQLAIKPELRLNRKWQQQYFKQEGVDIEAYKLQYSRRNTVNFQVAKQHRWESIEAKYFDNQLLASEINKINRQLSDIPYWMQLKNNLLTTMYIKEILKKIGFQDNLSKLLTEYQIIKPLEMVFRKEPMP